MRLKIINRSQWPDWAIKVLARWVCGQIKELPPRYTITMKQTCRKVGYLRGTGWRSGQTIRLHRRYQPYDGKWPMVHRYPWAGKTRSNFPEQVHRSRLELLVGIMAHECRHTSTYDEITCEHTENRVVEYFRQEWPTIRAQLKAAGREARIAKPMPDLTDKKLAAATAAMERWQRKAKLARTKIRKYERQVRYYSGRIAAKN